MAQSEALIDTLKTQLKARGMTYADIAKGLYMSEANIKRLFASRRFSLERVEDVCRLMNLDFIDLVRLYDESRVHISYLTEQQEQELVSDIRLLLVAVCARNHLGFEEIIETYEISESECIQYLAKLDRLKLIELLPRNRIRVLVNEDFRWLSGGPIEKFFKAKLQPEFLSADFSRSGQLRLFHTGLLSMSSREVLLRKLHKLRAEFIELQLQDMQLPVKEKNNEAIFIATRDWEFSLFKALRRKAEGGI